MSKLVLKQSVKAHGPLFFNFQPANPYPLSSSEGGYVDITVSKLLIFT